MQTTLLGIAIALILTLVTALVGPLLIDWGAYRPLIEAEATRIVGAQVHIAGAIDGRLLPSPRLSLHDVSIGSGSDQMRADELDLQFALTPLMRGEWQAEDMRLAGPKVTLALDKAGRLQAPAISAGFNPDAVTVDRLQIEGGTLSVHNTAGGPGLTLDGLFFNGRARSLLGPFNGSGAFRIGKESYTVEDFSTGRISDGRVKLRVALQPGEHPFKINGEGTFAVADGKPRFDGNLDLGPPPGLARQHGQAGKPWHVRGKLTANAGAALLQNLEFVYGRDAQALKLTGSVRLDFAKTPQLSAELNAPRLDLDRILAGSDGKPMAPAAALRELAPAWSGGAGFASSIPVAIGLSVDEVVLGGGSLLNVGGDLASTDDGWDVKKFGFRAPGFSQVALSGKLEVGKESIAFTGPAVIDAGDPKTLFAWLEGRGDTAPGDMRPFALRGDVSLDHEKLAIDDLTATIANKPVNGRIAYTFAASKEGAKLEANLNAQDIDLDNILDFGKAMLGGSYAGLPQEIALNADFRRARVGGVSGREVTANMTYGHNGLNIAKLSVADLGGAQFAAEGRIELGNSAQRGRLSADLTAPDAKPLIAVLSRFAPQAADWLPAAELSPAKLHGVLSFGGEAGQAKLALTGDLGRAHASLDAAGSADLMTGSFSDVRLKGSIGADDGHALLSLLHLDRAFAVDKGPGALAIEAHGSALTSMAVKADLTAAGLQANAQGRLDITSDKRRADLRIAIDKANASPLAGLDPSRPVPVTYRGRLSLSGDALTLSDIRAGVGGAKLAGKLALTLGAPLHVEGELEADTLNAPAAFAAALGMPPAPRPQSGAWAWSNEPFTHGLIGVLDGDVALKAHRVTLLPAFDAREFSGAVHFGANEIALRDVQASLGGGRLNGQIAFSRSEAELATEGKLDVSGADLTALIGSPARPPLSGIMRLALAIKGRGLSPVALVGSLQGLGKVTLAHAQLAGLDPRAFDAVTRAVDDGLPIQAGKIADLVGKSLTSGRLHLREAEGTLAVSAGQVRLDHVKASSDDADLSLSGALDLTDGLIDAHLVLSGSGQAAGARPDIYMALKGPIGAPERAVDVSALTGWLTLRSVENQARKVKALEDAAAKERAAREKAERERIARQRAEEERLAKQRAAAERATVAPLSIQPRTFPPLSPPVLVQPPGVGHRASSSAQAEAVSSNERIEDSEAAPMPLAPALETAPALPPPITIERLPGATASP